MFDFTEWKENLIENFYGFLERVGYIEGAVKSGIKGRFKKLGAKLSSFSVIKRITVLVCPILFIAAVAVSCILFINYRTDSMIREAEETPPSYRYGDIYYNTLTRREQILYDDIVTAAINYNEYTPILPHWYTDEEFKKICCFIDLERPDLFYISVNDLELHSEKNGGRTRVKLKYTDAKLNIEKRVKLFNETINKILNGIPDEADTEYEKGLYLHDYIVKNCSNTNAVSLNITDTAYSVIINGRSTPSGYAKAYKLLMNSIGLYCNSISGMIKNHKSGEYCDHIWNIVYTDGNFRYTDVSWDDPDIDFANDIVFHTYFNIGEQTLSLDHKVSYNTRLNFAENDNYYAAHGLYAGNERELRELLNKLLTTACENQSSYIELYPDLEAQIFTDSEHTDINNYFRDIIISEINKLGSNLLKPYVRAFSGSYDNNSIVLQIFYNN